MGCGRDGVPRCEQLKGLAWVLARVRVASGADASVRAVHILDCAVAAHDFWKQALWLSTNTTLIYTFYIAYGIVQERIYSIKYGEAQEKFDYSLFLVFVQCIMNALMALGYLLFERGSLAAVFPSRSGQHHHHRRPGPPVLDYFKIGFTYISSMFCSNASLQYVTYPTQVLAKSCKMIPVMLMRLIVNKKRYSLIEYVSVLLVTAGISAFMLLEPAKPGKLSSNSGMGVLLLLFSLALDGYTSPKQERVMEQFNSSEKEMMLYMNAFAVALVFPALISGGAFFPPIQFILRHPQILYDVSLSLPARARARSAASSPLPLTPPSLRRSSSSASPRRSGSSWSSRPWRSSTRSCWQR